MAASARIAVARCRRLDDYLASLRHAGADPVVVDPARDRALEVAGRVDGLVLTGGGDVDPALYGEERGLRIQSAEAGRDAFEIDLVARALERDLPLLAICRGMQVLNVACGGTLVQHIPEDVPQALEHDVSVRPDAIAHDVDMAAGSRLAHILGAASAGRVHRLRVNSRHHQAVKHLGPGLVSVASADDGVIEAVERPASGFCVGVQWHPENFWRTGEFDALFRAFVAACHKGNRPDA